MSSVRESENVTVELESLPNRHDLKRCLELVYPWTLINICRKNPNLIKIGQEYRALYWRFKNVLLFPTTSNCHKSAVFERNYIKLLGEPRRCQHYANSATVLRDAYKLCCDPAARARTANERNNGLAENCV